jgi:hypothetical protein
MSNEYIQTAQLRKKRCQNLVYLSLLFPLRIYNFNKKKVKYSLKYNSVDETITSNTGHLSFILSPQEGLTEINKILNEFAFISFFSGVKNVLSVLLVMFKYLQTIVMYHFFH